MSELVQSLIRATGLAERDVLRIISTAPSRYKEYLIPKRTGGTRLIAQPAVEVKALQRVFVREYLSKLPIHGAAAAYRIGRSIRDNALVHVENGPILKMDFKEFFPSIVPADWEKYCDSRGLFVDPYERHLTSQLLFHRRKGSTVLRLAIGAPSSPQLSNILMYEFDALVSEVVQKDFVAYTRYADDLTFSAKRTGYLVNVQRQVKRIVRDLRWPRLRINEDKTVLATKKYHRQVTGLVLSNDGKVSLGRDRKRLISSRVHHAKLGKLSREEAVNLSGQLSFVHAVEPEFLSKLEAKYGADIIARLKQLPSEI
jgi:hypothetical protein